MKFNTGNSIRKVLAIALVAVMSAALASCGSEKSEGSGTTASTAAAKPSLARVDGKWKWVAPKAKPKKGTWKVTSDCESGPCGFKAVSSAGFKGRFTPDEQLHAYLYKSTTRDDCKDQNGNVVKKNAYTIQTRKVATPTKAIAGDGGEIATQMVVMTTDKASVTKAAKKLGCPLTWRKSKYKTSLKRTDPPAGTPTPVD